MSQIVHSAPIRSRGSENGARTTTTLVSQGWGQMVPTKLTRNNTIRANAEIFVEARLSLVFCSKEPFGTPSRRCSLLRVARPMLYTGKDEHWSSSQHVSPEVWRQFACIRVWSRQCEPMLNRDWFCKRDGSFEPSFPRSRNCNFVTPAASLTCATTEKTDRTEMERGVAITLFVAAIMDTSSGCFFTGRLTAHSLCDTPSHPTLSPHVDGWLRFRNAW